MTEVMDELQRAYSVFTEKASEQARHMAWVIGVIYAKVSKYKVNPYAAVG